MLCMLSDMRKACSRDVNQNSVVPLTHPVRPEDVDWYLLFTSFMFVKAYILWIIMLLNTFFLNWYFNETIVLCAGLLIDISFNLPIGFPLAYWNLHDKQIQ